jgi:hypothetical protein
MPRPMTRRPPRLEPDEPEEPDALRAWLLPPLLDLLPVLRDPRLALPFPAVEPPLPLALIPPLLPPLLLPLPLCFAIVTLR